MLCLHNVQLRLRRREFALQALHLAAGGRLGESGAGRAAAGEFLFEPLGPYGRRFAFGKMGRFAPSDGPVAQSDLSEFAADRQRLEARSRMKGGEPLTLLILLGIDAEHEFVADIGRCRPPVRRRERQQQRAEAFHAAIPVCLSSGRTSGWRPRKRTNASIASRLPPRARMESRKRAAVARSNTPASSNASK